MQNLLLGHYGKSLHLLVNFTPPLSDQLTAVSPLPMATKTAAKVDNPSNAQISNPNQPSDPKPGVSTPEDTSAAEQPQPQSNGGGQVDVVEADTVKSKSDSSAAGPVSDTDKKMKRAERFGMPVVLSEAEKRNSRAERFGTASTVPGSDSSKQSEELKRKARAERFGIVQSAPADEGAKKKARLARFGSGTKADPLEEDKKKARAIRFSQPNSDSLPQGNGKGSIEVKTAVAGKTGGGT